MKHKTIIMRRALAFFGFLLPAFAAPVTTYAGVGAWTTGNWSTGFTAAEDNLIGGLSPSASSGLSNSEGGKNVMLLTDGQGASAKGDVQCVGNNAVLTYTLPQASRVNEVRIYSYWADNGRDQLSVSSVVLGFAGGATETVSPAAVTYQKYNNNKSFAYLAMADGTPLGREVTSVTINFGVQENNYVGYAEIEVCGSVGADDLLLVEGDPDENGDVSPAYGEHRGYAAGDPLVCSAPAAVTNQAGTIAAVCAGYKVYTNGVVYLEGDGNSFPYVHPDCISGARLVWLWDSQYRVTATAGAGGTVSPASQWVARGATATVTATSNDGHGFYQWTGDLPAGTDAYSRTVTFQVTEPVALTATFSSAYYVSQSGSDANDGTSWATAFATVEHALSQVPAGNTIFVGPGTFPVATTLALDHDITVQGAGATFAETTLDAGKARRVAVISHARAVLRNLTLANGYTGSTGTGGGGGCVRVTAGLVENCRITGGKVIRQGYGAGVFNNGGTIRDCVIDDNTAAGNIYVGLGLYQEGAASVTERCVITNNHYSACHNNAANQRCSAGLYLAGGLVRDTLIARNDAGELTEAGNGGNCASGVYQTGGTLLNCAVVENRFTKTSMASIDCAAFYRTSGSVVNCIVYGNVDGFGNPNDWKGAASFDHCVLRAGGGATGSGNVEAFSAPYLILADGTFLLPRSSCAVDAGAAQANQGATDLYGNARTTGDAVDAGPVECTTPTQLVAYFEASATEGASPLATTFTAVADGPDLTGLTYSWTFSDGTTTTTETTSSATLAHTFGTGTHTVSLTISNGGGASASLVRENYVFARPLVAYVDPNNASGAAFPYDTPETAATTLTAALEPQVNGLVVHLLPGTHPLADEVLVKRAVRILGADPATVTVRGGGKHRLFRLSGPAGAGGTFLSGVTLLNGYCDSGAGGGSDVCWAKGGGGALWIEVGSTASNCVVVGGTGVRSCASYGVYVDGGTFTHSTIRDITVGSTQDISFGTALRVIKGGFVNHCVVSNIQDTAHHQNYCGAAVQLTSGTIRNTLVTGADFFYVSTTAGKKLASAVKVDDGTLDACTIVGNHVNDGCAGVYSTGGTIRNCLVAENANGDGGTDAEWLRDNGTWSYVACTYTNGLPGTGHQLVSSPVCAAGSFMPAPGSRAIGNGLVEDWMADATDLAGNPRLGEGGVADIGAFAYVVPSIACSFTASALNGLGSLDTTLTATVDGDTDGIVYYWDTDGDGAADQIGSALSSIPVSFDTPGTYVATLCVTNGAGRGATSAPVSLVVSPAVIHVARDNAGAAFPYATWATAAASVEDGLAVAGNGTEIIVADGTYALTNTLALNLGVNLHSAGGSASDALLYCSGDFRAVTLDNAGAVFCGFTVSNGYLGYYAAPEYVPGGGDLLLNAGLAEKCRFTGARSDRLQKGVAVAVSGGTMRDCEIDGNRPRFTGNGAGQWSEVYYGVALHLSGGLVERCAIHDNHLAEAHRDYHCPAVYMIGGTLRGCLIADNSVEDGHEGSADKLVSGLYLTGGAVENCTIAGNRAQGYVGGVRAEGGKNAGTIRNSIIYGNTNTNGVSNTAGADVYAYCCLDTLEDHSGAGMVAADPLFRNPGAGNYRIDVSSPCAAAGLYNPAWMADYPDLAGRPLATRRQTVPMGCFSAAKGGTVIFMR